MAQMPKRTESGAILDKFEVQKPNTADGMITFDYNYKILLP